MKRAVSSWFGALTFVPARPGQRRIRRSDGGLSEHGSESEPGKKDPCTPLLKAPSHGPSTCNLQPPALP